VRAVWYRPVSTLINLAFLRM